MKSIKLHIAILFMLTCNFSYTQQYINYSIKDGLPSNRAYRLIQDKKGFIWVLTDKGMARFNGKDFKVFNTRNGLPTNDIWDIQIDKRDRAWYFSKSSKLGYIENDSVHVFSTCNPKDVLYPASTNIYDDKIVLGNASDWFYLKEDCWERIPDSMLENEGVSKFKTLHYKARQLYKNFDRKDFANTKYRNLDSIMVMLYEEGYSVININTGKIHNGQYRQFANPENPRFVRNNFVNGEIQITGFDFVATLGKDYGIKRVVKIPSNLKAYFSMIDRTGNVWCATYSHGIFMLPKVKREISYLLPGEKVDQIKKVGHKIIASVYNKGFYEYDSIEKNFKSFIPDNSFSYSATYIDSLKSYFFTSELKNTQIKYANGKSRIIETKKILGVRNLLLFNGFLYGNDAVGVKKINPNTLEVIASYQQYGVVDLTQFKDQLILATSNGLMVLENGNFKKLDFEKNIIQKPVLGIKKVSDSLLLVNTDGYGAYTTNLKTVDILPKTEYLSIANGYVDTDTIWLASEIGILHYEKNGGQYKCVGKFDESDGLPSKKVNAIIINGNDIIVSTDSGIAILPKKIEKQSQLLDIYIEKALFNQKAKINDENHFKYKVRNNVDFSIATIDFTTNTDALNYEYRLMPLQTEWAKTSSSSLNFNDLPPNHYTLQLRANTIEKKFRFSITPLWWQRPISKMGFVVLGIILLLLVLYLIRRHELAKKLKKINDQKKMAQFQLYALRSQMNPHFVFNSLAAIQYYINNNDFDESEKYLVKFSKLIRRYFEISKEEELSLEEEIALLKSYLEIEKLRFKEKLDFKINVDSFLNTKTTKIPTMLLQPVVENAVNHGIFNKIDPGAVTITFKLTDTKEFTVEIMDDGVGLSNTMKRKREKKKSSTVLKDRLFFLNQSGRWKIEYKNIVAFPQSDDKGNISIFTIKRTK